MAALAGILCDVGVGLLERGIVNGERSGCSIEGQGGRFAIDDLGVNPTIRVVLKHGQVALPARGAALVHRKVFASPVNSKAIRIRHISIESLGIMLPVIHIRETTTGVFSPVKQVYAFRRFQVNRKVHNVLHHLICGADRLFIGDLFVAP